VTALTYACTWITSAFVPRQVSRAALQAIAATVDVTEYGIYVIH
jgi:hypothetical protein